MVRNIKTTVVAATLAIASVVAMAPAANAQYYRPMPGPGYAMRPMPGPGYAMPGRGYGMPGPMMPGPMMPGPIAYPRPIPPVVMPYPGPAYPRPVYPQPQPTYGGGGGGGGGGIQLPTLDQDIQILGTACALFC